MNPTPPPRNNSNLTPVPLKGGVSAFHTGNTSAFHALQTIIEPGTRIGNYVVGQLLGRGNIAAVYHATHMETGEVAALKVLDPRYALNPAIAQAFAEDAADLARTVHDNIVHYYDNGRDGEFVYLAEEFVPGITLDQLQQSIEIESHHLAHIVHELSKALTTIHATGQWHGDIKPTNILVTRPGDVKLTEACRHAREAVAAARAQEGKATTASRYKAPECFSTDGPPPDFSADVYSLGAVFYKLLTGQLPEDPVVSPTELKPDLPPAVDTVLLRALRPDPRERYVTAKEFCDALGGLFDKTLLSTPVAVTPDPRAVAEAETTANIPKPQAEGVDWRLLGIIATVGVIAAILALIYFIRQ